MDCCDSFREWMKELESEYFDWCVNRDTQINSMLDYIQFNSIIEFGNRINQSIAEMSFPAMGVDQPMVAKRVKTAKPIQPKAVKREWLIIGSNGTIQFLKEQLNISNSYIKWINKADKIFIIKSYKCLDLEYRLYRMKIRSKQITKYVLSKNIKANIDKGRIKRCPDIGQTVYQFLI